MGVLFTVFYRQQSRDFDSLKEVRPRNRGSPLVPWVVQLKPEKKLSKNLWCVARHVKNLDKKIFKKLTLAKILCWTFRQLLLPSSAKDKKCKCANLLFFILC